MKTQDLLALIDELAETEGVVVALWHDDMSGMRLFSSLEKAVEWFDIHMLGFVGDGYSVIDHGRIFCSEPLGSENSAGMLINFIRLDTGVAWS